MIQIYDKPKHRREKRFFTYFIVVTCFKLFLTFKIICPTLLTMNRRKGVKYYDGQMCSKLSASGHDASIVVSVVNKFYRGWVSLTTRWTFVMKFGCAVRGKGRVWSTSRPLISYRTLAVPRTSRPITFGNRSFAVTGPRVWNSVADTIRHITSYG